MKQVAILALLVFTFSCASLRTIRDETAAFGLFRLREIGGTHDIELRTDHTCVISSYGAFQKPSPTHGTWTFVDGTVTISPSDAPMFSLILSRRGFDVVMYATNGRGPYVRTAEKEPNKALL
jgi:hypothetical protein